MAHDVHLHVSFECNDNGPLGKLALKHLATLSDDVCVEARMFLQDLSERKGRNPGMKGGLCLWGIVGNYSNADTFITDLRRFWIELWNCEHTEYECGFMPFRHIVVFEEQEQSEQAKAYCLTPVGGDKVGRYDYEVTDYLVTSHKLPFCWNQL